MKRKASHKMKKESKANKVNYFKALLNDHHRVKATSGRISFRNVDIQLQCHHLLIMGPSYRTTRQEIISMCEGEEHDQKRFNRAHKSACFWTNAGAGGR